MQSGFAHLDTAIHRQMLARSELVDKGVKLRTVTERLANRSLARCDVVAEQERLACRRQNVGGKPNGVSAKTKGCLSLAKAARLEGTELYEHTTSIGQKQGAPGHGLTGGSKHF